MKGWRTDGSLGEAAAGGKDVRDLGLRFVVCGVDPAVVSTVLGWSGCRGRLRTRCAWRVRRAWEPWPMLVVSSEEESRESVCCSDVMGNFFDQMQGHLDESRHCFIR